MFFEPKDDSKDIQTNTVLAAKRMIFPAPILFGGVDLRTGGKGIPDNFKLNHTNVRLAALLIFNCGVKHITTGD